MASRMPPKVIDPEWLVEAMRASGVHASEIARRIDSDPGTISELKLGKRRLLRGRWLEILKAIEDDLPDGWQPPGWDDVDEGQPPSFAFRTHLPLYSLAAACGPFAEGQHVEPEAWVDAASIGRKLDDKMFIVRAKGRSMEPLIGDGDLVVFRRVDGLPHGKVVLAQHRDIHDEETGGSFTIKRLDVVETVTSGFEYRTIKLRPENDDYKPIRVEAREDLKIVGELVDVLRGGA